jgi:hypothetical protein
MSTAREFVRIREPSLFTTPTTKKDINDLQGLIDERAQQKEKGNHTVGDFADRVWIIGREVLLVLERVLDYETNDCDLVLLALAMSSSNRLAFNSTRFLLGALHWIYIFTL